MCGICGALNVGSAGVAVEHTADMTRALRHRGPDQAGVLNDPPVILGHARLSIIDLSAGKQPMHSVDGRFAIVFNGEIFNYLELRAQQSGTSEVTVSISHTGDVAVAVTVALREPVHEGSAPNLVGDSRENSIFQLRGNSS